VRLQDSGALFSACQVALPSWAGAPLSTFSCTKLSGGFSSPGLYLVSCTAQGAAPTRAVVKLDVESKGHSLYQFYQDLATSEGPYQGKVSRQLGEAELGPDMLYVEQGRGGQYWGLMVMEELTDGGFAEEFDSKNVTKKDMASLGFLLGKMHKLPTNLVSSAASLARTRLLECGMDKEVVEELYQDRGGYIVFLILWWNKLFPDWLATNSPIIHPLPSSYVERFHKIILRAGRIKPLSELGRVGFSHCDVHCSNLMRKGGRIIAIDCETANTGPALTDLGGIVWNGRAGNGSFPHLDRSLREALIISFYQTIGEECRDMEAALYDLELGCLYRLIWRDLCAMLGLVSNSLHTLLRVGGLQSERLEVMVSGLERAVDDKELMRSVLDKGIYWSIRDQLSEGHEESIRQYGI